MTGVRVNVLQNTLATETKRAIHSAIASVVEESAEDVRRDWKARAPVDRGDYRDSIRVEKGKHEGQRIVATNLPGDDPYDIYYEFGTEDQPARPVARQAANKHRKGFRTKVTRKVEDATADA